MNASKLGVFCVGTALIVLACGQDRTTFKKANIDPPTQVRGTTSEQLRVDEQLHTGLDLPAKTLALTFDDGPGETSYTPLLSAYLKAQGIKATFFVNGACIAAVPGTLSENDSCQEPRANSNATMAQIIADGHMIGNHTTTHRDMVSEVPNAQRVEELTFTDTLITPYVKPDRLFFRAPYGDWAGGAAPDAFATVSASPMNKYVGPIYWGPGGGPTDTTAAATMAADWECWQNLGYTTMQCATRYLNEIHALTKGIVLMHDEKCAIVNGDDDCTNLTNTNLNAGVGNTLAMVKYLIPLLKADGYSFTTIDEVPSVKADLCAKECATCNGATCLTCAAGKFLANNTCTDCTKTCAAGKFQTAACTASADTTCNACTACAAGTFQATACSATADTVCTPCAPGTFSSTGAAKCDSCGSCDDNDACTTDACAATGCTHTPIAGCAGGGASSSSSSGTTSGSTSSGNANPNSPDGGAPADGSGDKGCTMIANGATGGSGTSRGASTWLLAIAGLAAAWTRRRRRS